ncbi:MAG: ABC transporter permease [Gammaproteobacteria bacterium]
MSNNSQLTAATQRWRLWALLPSWVVVGVFMLGPIFIMAAVSLMEANTYGGVRPNFTLEAYQQILWARNLFDELEFTTAYLSIVGRSIVLALVATVMCLAVGFPAAYYMSQQPPSRKNILIFLVTIPFWTNLLVRTYAWIIILGRNGVIEAPFRWFGWLPTDETLGLMYSNFAIVVGLTYSYLPLMVLPLFAAMEKLDPRLLEAGGDLYARRRDLVRRVIIPLTMPGIIGGCILVYVPSLGAFIAPDLLGGGKHLMLGSLVQLQFASARNWPFGAAVAMVLLAVVVVCLMVQARAAAKNKAQTI